MLVYTVGGLYLLTEKYAQDCEGKVMQLYLLDALLAWLELKVKNYWQALGIARTI